ncbi:hypothetical protein ACFL0V_04600 [Nanoarchaeota archaeon]
MAAKLEKPPAPSKGSTVEKAPKAQIASGPKVLGRKKPILAIILIVVGVLLLLAGVAVYYFNINLW